MGVLILVLQILLIALVLARASVSVGLRVGLLDHPDSRKSHVGAIPLSGGLAIFLTIITGSFLLGIPPFTWAMLAIAAFVFIIGVFDDVKHINPWIRLGIEYGAGIVLATWGGISIQNVGNLLAMGDIPLLLLAAPLTALSVAGLCNAYNMLDGIDGVSSSLVALPLAVLFGLAVKAGHPHANALLLMLIPIGVFLLFNLGPNNALLPKMFLGDSGSITLGFLVTAALVFFSQGETAIIEPVTALWLVCLPLMDMLATMLRRARKRLPLMEADRMHLHHTLVDTTGLGKRAALAVMVSYGAIAAAAGLALEALPAYVSLALYFLLFAIHCGFVIKAESLATKKPGKPALLP